MNMSYKSVKSDEKYRPSEFVEAIKNIKSAIVNKKTKPKIIKKIILNPDTKIIVSQVSTNNNVCPRSGWFTKKNTINNKIKRE